MEREAIVPGEWPICKIQASFALWGLTADGAENADAAAMLASEEMTRMLEGSHGFDDLGSGFSLSYFSHCPSPFRFAESSSWVRPHPFFLKPSPISLKKEEAPLRRLLLCWCGTY